MYLKIKNDEFTEHIFKEIELITSSAKLLFKNIVYNNEEKMINIPIKRYEIESVKKNIFSPKLSYKYNKISSLITIRNVSRYQVENYFEDPDVTEITILFGMKYLNNEIHFSSVEESKGQQMFLLRINITGIDIEICDQRKGNEKSDGVRS